MIESRWSTTGEWFKSAQPVSRSNVKIGRYLELVSKTMDIQYLEDPYDNAVLKALTEFLIFAMFVPVIKDRRFARPVDPDLSITKPVDITVQKYGTDSEGEPYYLASHLYDTTRVLLGGLGPLLGELTGMLQMFPEVAAELEVLTETELYSKLDPNKEPYHDDNWSVILSVIGTVSKKRYDIIARDMMPSLALMIGGPEVLLADNARALVGSYYKLIGRPLKPELYSIFGAMEGLTIPVIMLLVDLLDLLEPLTIEDLNEYEIPLVPPVELRGLKLTDDSAHQWFSMVHRLSRIEGLTKVYYWLDFPQVGDSYAYRNQPPGGLLPWFIGDIGQTVGLMGRNLQIGEWYRDYPDVPCMINIAVKFNIYSEEPRFHILIIRGWRETTTYDYDPAISVILTVSKTRDFRPEDLLYPPTEIPLPIPPVGVRTARDVRAVEEIVVFNESIDELDDLYIKTTTTYESGEVFVDFVDVIDRVD